MEDVLCGIPLADRRFNGKHDQWLNDKSRDDYAVAGLWKPVWQQFDRDN
jgi:hypothetical protein